MSASVGMQGRPKRISQTRIGGVTILRPVGPLDGGLADVIMEASLEAHGPVVVDLREAVLVDAAPLQRIVHGWELYRPPMCIVSNRLAARSLLRRADIHQHVPVFESVEDALDADGWRLRRT